MSLMRRERPLVEWPWPEERFDRMFRDIVRDFFSQGLAVDRLVEAWPNPLRVEEYVENGTCVIRAELPGVDPEKDVTVEFADGMIHLRAQREERNEEERPSGYRSDFLYGSFERRLRLPEGATEADVKATYNDGILEIRVPVATAAKPAPTRIAVEHS